MQKIIKCPHCGSDDGVCIGFNVSGMDYYKFNGMFDGEDITGSYRHNKYMMCVNCGKRIMTFEEFKRDYLPED